MHFQIPVAFCGVNLEKLIPLGNEISSLFYKYYYYYYNLLIDFIFSFWTSKGSTAAKPALYKHVCTEMPGLVAVKSIQEGCFVYIVKYFI